MDDRFQRLGLLAGIDALEALARTKVAVFGLGGVGSWCAEALARSGAGKLVLVDYDTVSVTNINRQAEAVNATIGEVKARAMAKRIAEINPACETTIIAERFSRRGTFEETAAMFGIDGANYVIDAIDSLDSKLDLIETAAAAGKNFFSSMGMAKKLDPTLIRTADIWKTAGCPLARRVREGLRKRGFGGHFTAVYSAEQSRVNKTRLESGITENETPEDSFGKKAINGSVVTVTASTGMILASLVLRDVFARAGEANP